MGRTHLKKMGCLALVRPCRLMGAGLPFLSRTTESTRRGSFRQALSDAKCKARRRSEPHL
jgi:hypothetical protein